MIFSLEEDVVLEDTTGAAAAAAAALAGNKLRPKSPHHSTSYNSRLQNPPKLRHVSIRRHILFSLLKYTKLSGIFKPFFVFQTPPRERYGVDITPLSYVPGGKIERYLGNLNFFFIRESTAIREVQHSLSFSLYPYFYQLIFLSHLKLYFEHLFFSEWRS